MSRPMMLIGALLAGIYTADTSPLFKYDSRVKEIPGDPSNEIHQFRHALANNYTGNPGSPSQSPYC
jgi:hypothetical protein